MGYIKLINPSLTRFTVFTDPLKPEVLDPKFIYSLEVGDELPRLRLNLQEFYTLNPTNLTDENKSAYLEQKKLAEKLEEISSKYKINEYTKQINLNFGYMNIQISDDELTESEDEDTEVRKKRAVGKTWHPIFSFPVAITAAQGLSSGESTKVYSLQILESDIIPNIGFLQPIAGEENYAKLAQFINSLEVDGELKLPIKKATIDQIWTETKSYLKLSNAVFDEDSFEIERLVVSLASKSNFFLAQDLGELEEMDEAELADTALSSWVSDEEMSIEEAIDEDKDELFFPFDYDKHQVRTLSIINNRASIVQGPPGTGKSQTIANILSHLAANGHRVLFLSQKDQALRGVKDTLKKLDIQYLYGYIPNRQSPLYTPEDERDGAAFALSGIEHYIDGALKSDGIPPRPAPKSVLAKMFDNSIELQEQYFELHQKLTDLQRYDISLDDADKFVDRFNITKLTEIGEALSEQQKLQNSCGNYVSKNPAASEFGELFANIDFQHDHYFQYLDHIISVIEQEGYDRKGKLGRTFKNTMLKMKLKDHTGKLPRELFDQFERIIGNDGSRADAVHELKAIRNYCFYREYLARINALTEQVDVALLESGLSRSSFAKLIRLIDQENEQTVITHIVERLKIADQLAELTLTNPNIVNQSIYGISADRKARVNTYIRNRLNQRIQEIVKNRSVRGILYRISKALQKSKKAYKTFDQFKNNSGNFDVLREIIPIWIMDLEDVSRLIPLQKNLFDYIIIDEASQCNLAYAVPAMFRSKHVMFFGDTEQMRDSSVRFKTNRSLDELAAKFSIPDYLRIKGTGDSIKSVMDIGLMVGFKSQSLLYHYRSPRELIGFSNNNFYAPKRRKMEVINSNYLTYKDTNRVLINHTIEANKDDDIGDKTNIAEAKYIKNLIADLRADKATMHKSIGVLTFFNEQAVLLRELIDDDTIKVAIIEGIQGDERDIIIYSFVITDPSQKNRYVALTSEGGEVNQDANAGRVNVAFSRARQQVHTVTSMPTHQWPDGVWIKRYLEYIDEHGEVDFYDIHLKDFDSQFEQDFYNFLRDSLDKRFQIQNQIESCGFKLDFVVTDTETQAKLAVECDGPCHFEKENPEIRVEGDYERQSILEAAGWIFYRVLYSDWINREADRKLYIDDILAYFDNPETGTIKTKLETSQGATESLVQSVKVVRIDEQSDDGDIDATELSGVVPDVETSHAQSRKASIQKGIREDVTPLTTISNMRPGRNKIKGKITSITSRKTRKSHLTIYEATISDDTGTVNAVWFNKPYLRTFFDRNKEYVFIGNLEFKFNNLSLQSPTFTLAEQAIPAE